VGSSFVEYLSGEQSGVDELSRLFRAIECTPNVRNFERYARTSDPSVSPPPSFHGRRCKRSELIISARCLRGSVENTIYFRRAIYFQRITLPTTGKRCRRGFHSARKIGRFSIRRKTDFYVDVYIYIYIDDVHNMPSS